MKTTCYVIGKERRITAIATLNEARTFAKSLVLADKNDRGSATICTADEAGNLTVVSDYVGNCGVAHHPHVVTVAWCEGEPHGNLADYASR